MRRLLALVAAAGMIGVALLVRSVLDGGGGDGDGDDRGDGDVAVIACTAELAAACDEWDDARDDVEVRVEEASETLGSVLDRSTEVDGWLAPRGWVELARDVDDPVVGEPSSVIARSAVAVVVVDELYEPLAEACGGEVTWSCLGERAGERGLDRIPGALEVGLVDPETGNGLPVLGAAATGYFGDADYASNDFDGEFDDWLSGLAINKDEITRNAREPVARLLTERGRFVAVGALDAAAAQASDGRRARVIYPAPVATADLVLAPIGRRLSDGGRDDLARHDSLVDGLLAIEGWVRPGSGDLPDTDNQPRGGVLAALLDRWREAR